MDYTVHTYTVHIYTNTLNEIRSYDCHVVIMIILYSLICHITQLQGLTKSLLSLNIKLSHVDLS